MRDALEAPARRWVEGVRAQLDAPEREVPVDVEAVTGSPTTVLVERSEGAELLVVGHRGRGPLRNTLLGSVALGCVLRAGCPVTVVPGEGSSRPGAAAAAQAEVHV